MRSLVRICVFVIHGVIASSLERRMMISSSHAEAPFLALFAFIILTKSSKHGSESCGPGDASGWYWMVIAIFSSYTIPAHVPSFRLMCEICTSFGNESGNTAKLWFWEEISTRPVGPRTGWFPPWCPNLSLNVSPPNAWPRTWCPMQMPNTGTTPRISSAFFTAYGTADGSPGPLLNKMPSGFMASTSDAGVFAGTTVSLHPKLASRRMMLCLIPKS
mmetsp:Transcript_4344/g.17331  ORF Transcript_4344/g.17331 Transcript_4344/m.17331 type:complete len:217 (+) Transcript_4344:90-740(+)